MSNSKTVSVNSFDDFLSESKAVRWSIDNSGATGFKWVVTMGIPLGMRGVGHSGVGDSLLQACGNCLWKLQERQKRK